MWWNKSIVTYTYKKNGYDCVIEEMMIGDKLRFLWRVKYDRCQDFIACGDSGSLRDAKLGCTSAMSLDAQTRLREFLDDLSACYPHD